MWTVYAHRTRTQPVNNKYVHVHEQEETAATKEYDVT